MYNHYDIARKIVKYLRQEGFSDVAEQLEEDLGGFSGTEIFMALRWHLKQFLETKQECSEGLKSLIDKLLQELDSALA
jgi:hypothetical protein